MLIQGIWDKAWELAASSGIEDMLVLRDRALEQTGDPRTSCLLLENGITECSSCGLVRLKSDTSIHRSG